MALFFPSLPPFFFFPERMLPAPESSKSPYGLCTTATNCPSPFTSPGTNCNPPNSVEITPDSEAVGNNVNVIIAPRVSCRKRRLPSFSSLLYVQVEYTRYPPGATAGQISARIRCCLWAQRFTFAGLHSSTAWESLRKSPSPEQGASTTTRLK